MKASPNAGDEALGQMSQAVQFNKSEGIEVLLLGTSEDDWGNGPGTRHTCHFCHVVQAQALIGGAGQIAAA